MMGVGLQNGWSYLSVSVFLKIRLITEAALCSRCGHLLITVLLEGDLDI